MRNPVRHTTRYLAIPLAILVLGSTAVFAADGPVGTWNVTLDLMGQQIESVLTITEENGEYSGSASSDQGDLELANIEYSNGDLTFTVDAQGINASFAGKIDGDTLTGKYEIPDMGIEMDATGTRAGGTPALVGTWDIVVDAMGGQKQPAVLTIVEENGGYSGTTTSDQGEVELANIKFEDGKLTYTIEIEGPGIIISFLGTIDGDKLTGKYEIPDIGIEMASTGTRRGATTETPDIAGTWKLAVNVAGQEDEATLTIVEEGGKFTGTVLADGNTIGDIAIGYEDGELIFTIEDPDSGMTFNFIGTIDGDSLQGKIEVPDAGFEMDITGTRGGAAPAIVGTWNLTVDSQLGSNARTLVVNDDLSGTYGGGDFAAFVISNVMTEGNTVTFDVTLDVQGQSLPSKVTLTLDGNKVTGKLDFGQGEATIVGEKGN